MTDATLERRMLVSLRIALSPFPENNRELQFTVVDKAGTPLDATVNVGKEFEQLHDMVSGIAAKTLAPPRETPFGQPQQPRVMIGFDGAKAPNYRFHFTIVYAAGDGSPLPPTTYIAPVSEASLARLADALRTVAEAGSGVAEWTAAG